MTITFAKKIVACVALSTVCFASTAHAGNAFNKFPTQPATQTQQGVRTSSYTVIKTSKSETVNNKRTLNRVVEPATPDVAFFSANGPSNARNDFNKMVSKTHTVSRAMPVLNTRAVTIR